jgi:hypothetical protein
MVSGDRRRRVSYRCQTPGRQDARPAANGKPPGAPENAPATLARRLAGDSLAADCEATMDVAGLLSTLSAAIKFAGELNEAGKLLDHAEWKLKVADLKSTLADAKIAVVEFKDTIDAREKEIERLKTNFRLREDCVRYEPFLYAKAQTECRLAILIVHAANKSMG